MTIVQYFSDTNNFKGIIMTWISLILNVEWFSGKLDDIAHEYLKDFLLICCLERFIQINLFDIDLFHVI